MPKDEGYQSALECSTSQFVENKLVNMEECYKRHKNLMDLTYPKRRQEISEGMEIATILKMYPPLKKIDQVYSNTNTQKQA